MKIKKLDELQYIKRGNIFKHCLFTIIGLLLIYLTLLEFNIVFMNQHSALILIIVFIVSLFSIEMVCYEIYPLSEKRQKFLYIFEGLFGLAVIIMTGYELIFREASFIENQMLSDIGTFFIAGCFVLMIFFAYIIKKIYNKMKGDV